MKKFASLVPCLAVVILLAGCSGGSDATSNDGDSDQTTAPDGATFVLDEEPDGAVDVKVGRASILDGDKVAVVGRIGGSKTPWIEGRAAFHIVDLSLLPCNEISGDRCSAPWDYCCESDLPNAMAFVKMVDDEGNVVEADAKELLGVEELTTVVVDGIAERDDAGNLTILASGLFVRP